MTIIYKYTIISADESARCMEIMYESEGLKTMQIGARLPYDNETLEQIVRMYAPLALWETVVRNVITPNVGATGVVNTADVIPDADPEQLANAQMWEQFSFEKRIADALVKFGVLTSDPTSIPVAKL